jgi:hypothetical protein
MNRAMTKMTTGVAPSATEHLHSPSKELAELKLTVARNHLGWIKENPKSTLGELRDYMLEVRAEMNQRNDDELVADLDEVAAEYCASFGEDDVTVGYRLANVEEDISVIEELIEELDEQYKVRSLMRGTTKSQLEEPLTEKQRKYLVP